MGVVLSVATRTTKVWPVTLGVPLMTPVDAFRLSPVGRELLWLDREYV